MADQMALTKPARAGLPSQPSRNVRQQVPAFLNKLYAMVNDPVTDDLIHWSEEGDSFFVPNHERFGRELLPRFFKHGNFSSFVRQLNMYGFHKVPLVNQGVLHNETENELWQFASPHFQRGQPDLLMLIQRKKAGTSTSQTGAQASAPAVSEDLDTTTTTEQHAAGSGTRSPPSSDSRALDISAIASTLASIKRHQTALSAELKGLHDSDERLWQEAQSARKRLDQHQDTINRILKFLAGVFGNGAAGPGGHGARVREHAQADNDGASEAGDASTALVPRKRPRLMIEQSGSNEDIPLASADSKPKDKGRITHAAQLEDDDDDSDWAEEHLLVPMDDHIATPSQGIKSPNMSTPHSSHRRAPSEARIESVATSPAATSVPPTPGIAQVHEIPPTAPAQSIGPTPSTSLGLGTGMPQAAPYITPQPNTLMNTQPYSLPSQALTTNPSYNSTAPLDPSSATDQAAWQSLLNSPTGMQMFLNAMSQPNAFPTIPPMPSTIPGMDGQAGHLDYTNPYGVGSGNTTGQLIQTTANPFAGLVPPAQFPAYDMSGQGPIGTLPDNMLSLFNSNSGLMPMDALGAHSAQLAQTTDKHKAIDARVDALGQSLNSLLGHINLDPASMLPLDHNDAVDSSQHLTQPNQPMDFSSMLQPTSSDGAVGPITGADFDAFDAHPQTGQTDQNSSAFLDEVGTASTASSPNLDVKDIQSSNKGSSPQTRKSKRKSDAMEVDDAVPQAMRPIKSKKPTRKK